MTVEQTIANGAFDAQSQYYTSYVLGKGAINDHNYYISDDEKHVIYFNSCGSWAFQPASNSRYGLKTEVFQLYLRRMRQNTGCPEVGDPTLIGKIFSKSSLTKISF